jgi:lipopolysaccharide biosynthesis glycosyltransferase
MSKNLVLQLAVKLDQSETTKSNKITTFSYVDDMYKVSEEKARKYAQKFSADYYVVTHKNDWSPGIGRHISYQKFKVYDFLEYDKILYVDSDYIIKDAAPNLFELYNDFAAVVDPGETEKLAAGIGIPKERYFNSGFVLFTKDVLIKTKNNILKCDLSAKWKLMDQAVWNKIMYEAGIDFIKLDADHWNPVTKTFGLYGDHYSGINKSLWDSNRY